MDLVILIEPLIMVSNVLIQIAFWERMFLTTRLAHTAEHESREEDTGYSSLFLQYLVSLTIEYHILKTLISLLYSAVIAGFLRMLAWVRLSVQGTRSPTIETVGLRLKTADKEGTT